MVAVEATNRSTALLLVAAPVATVFLIKKFSVPPVNEEMANEVLGLWKDMELDQSLSFMSSTPSQDDRSSSGGNYQQVFSVWAHRFAGLDAPENTLEALDVVRH